MRLNASAVGKDNDGHRLDDLSWQSGADYRYFRRRIVQPDHAPHTVTGLKYAVTSIQYELRQMAGILTKMAVAETRLDKLPIPVDEGI
jgi:hypothetical protein